MDESKADEALSQGLSRTISYLKRLTKDTEHQISFPEDYVYDVSARGKPVSPRTLFGDEAPATLEDRRTAFADWMVSPRNPRFASNIANRLWKRVMGMGLIEPVDSFSAINQVEHTEILDFLTQTIVRLGYDERALLAVLLRSQLYQSASTREEAKPEATFDLCGPLLRRLSAEQLWDSMLVLLVEDIDMRKNRLRHDRTELSPERLRKLTTMTAEQILERAKVEMEQRVKHREFVQQLASQREAIDAMKAKGDDDETRRLQAEHAIENARFERERNAIQMGGAYLAEETDPRWSKLPNHLVRASETPTPIPLGHFLRQFGQSDRREIDAFNKDPNTTHSLALMNGDMTRMAIEKDSFLRSQLRPYHDDVQRIQAIYRAILVRSPDAEELEQSVELCKKSPSLETDLIWALLNTPEFLFIQ